MSDAPIQPERRPPLPYPGERAEDPYLPPIGGDPQAAKKRLLVPGIFVILIGLMNLLPGSCCLGFGLMAQTIPDAQLAAETKKYSSPGELEKARQQGQDPVALAKGMYLYGGIGVSVVSVLLLLVTLVGGGCMIAGRSLFLCWVGALAAMFSPGGFGIFGLAVGIWAFVVLLNEDVRHAFRTA